MENFVNTIHLFNDNEEEIPLSKCEKWDGAYYTYFTGSPEQAKAFAEIWNEYCSDSCPVDERHYKKGLYAYDEQYNDWLFIPDMIKFYTDMYKNFENRINSEEE